MTLTPAQIKALRMVAKRDWPAGEPRRSWINGNTYRVVARLGLIAERPGTEDAGCRISPIIDLTQAGRDALAAK